MDPADYETLLTDLRTAYDLGAAQRDSRQEEPFKIVVRNGFLQALRQAGGTNILDLGAGPGTHALAFLEAGLSVVCVDLSPEMVRRCRAKGLTACVMDVRHLQFAAETFDGVFALNSLLHLPPEALPAVLEGIRSVLRPGGLFYLGTYGGYPWQGTWDGDDHVPKRFFCFYSDDQLQRIAGQHFLLRSFKRIPLPNNSSRLHFQSLMLQRP